jgi:hypothetical protein
VEKIVVDNSATNEQKKELVEVATAISDQVVSKAPSKTVARTLFGQLVSMSSGFATIAAAVEELHKVWRAFSQG